MPKKAAHKKNHQRTRKSQNPHKKVRLALAVLAIIFFTIILGKLLGFIIGLYQPAEDGQIKKNYVLKGVGDINVLINRQQEISLVSYNPNQEKVVVLTIPDNTYLPVPEGHGSWLVSSVYKLGQSEKAPSGNRLLVNSLSNFLGLPIDGYLSSDAVNPIDTPRLISEIRSNPLKIITWGSRLHGNLNKGEIYRFLLGVSKVRFDKVQTIDLGNYLTSTSLADGSQVETADPVKVDSLAVNFYDNALTGERLGIAIVNATDIPGLAAKASRIVENIGGNVVITTTSTKQSKNTQVFGKDSKTLTRLNQVFNSGCQNNPKCDKIDLGGLQIQNRADVIVVLGQDYSDRF